MIFLFLVYPTAAVASLRAFVCQDLNIDGNRLKADFNEMCPMDNKMGFVFLYSLVCAALYPVHPYTHSEGGISCVPLVGAWSNYNLTPHGTKTCSRLTTFD